jgi:hypothetical protein
MKNPIFLPFIFICLIFGLISCGEKTETTANSEIQTESTEMVDSSSISPDDNSPKNNNQPNNSPNTNSSSAKNPSTQKQSNVTPPSKGRDWVTIKNDKWTITVGKGESWNGVNGTGDLTYYGCDNQNTCLALTGGKVTCRDGICTTSWRNGNYTYSIQETITEDGSGDSTLIVRENDKVILNQTGFFVVESNTNIGEELDNSLSTNANPKTLNNKELQGVKSLFKGENVNEKQTFQVNLQGWGNSIFTVVEKVEEGYTVFNYYLVQNDQIIYAFPLQEDVTYWSGYNVDAVSFKDVDKDGNQDIIVMASYITGIGRTGAQPFPVTTVYFNDQNDFFMDDELNLELSNKQPSTMAEVNRILDNY